MEFIYNVFYVLFCKYVGYPSHVMRIKDVKLDDNLIHKEQLMQILDRKVKELWNNQISLVKFVVESQGWGSYMESGVKYDT